MFDLGWDKIVLVGILVGLVAGPERLVAWSKTAVQLLGRIRGAYQDGKSNVVGELDQFAPDWRTYDPRQIDPRRIIKSALTDGKFGKPLSATRSEDAAVAPTLAPIGPAHEPMAVTLDPLGAPGFPEPPHLLTEMGMEPKPDHDAGSGDIAK
ncbi:Sec-independent protein translocase family protein [Microbacterium testaceum]|uniref:Sec-independent protein translocase TatB n=1 Tax=Microbacterium testaceum TaxID=2033 RepID=UPI002AC6461F|nr:Sec-independent protein translocase TatB [Microbacterium testaceum]MDZ5146123.1 Sec-independent protein translocase TatB [Microbacterium testaceum]